MYNYMYVFICSYYKEIKIGQKPLEIKKRKTDQINEKPFGKCLSMIATLKLVLNQSHS